MPNMKTRVLVVDDSALVRSLLSEIINRQQDMICVGAASDPLVAREMIRNLNPDVITLDIEMPRMDGIDFLAKLMRLRPMPVVMVSTLTERGADITLRALELGAVDFVAKPKIGVANGLRQLGDDITDKVRAAAQAKVRRTVAQSATPCKGSAPDGAGGVGTMNSPPARVAASALADVGHLSTEKLIVIGASTGGTEATREVLTQLPADTPGVLITQHMPAGFTTRYAARLNSLCRMQVSEAKNGERVLPGHAYIAPGGLHMSVERSGANYLICIADGEPMNRHKPSVDVLFRSVARVAGRNTLGVMLTGMGNDGAAAMRELRDAGAFNLAQDEASCVVFGMPREAIAHDAVNEVLPLNRIAPRLVELLKLHSGATVRI